MNTKNIILIIFLIFAGVFVSGINKTSAIGVDTGCGSCGGNVGFDGMGLDNPPNPDIVTCTLTATPKVIDAGGYTTLTWRTYLATKATIDGIGNVNTVSGSMQVGPLDKDTTYKMRVTGMGIPGTCFAKVKVKQTTPPSCTISATPSLVSYGGSSTLVWSSNNATSATITDLGSTGLSGSYALSNITANKTYTMTVTGPGGTSQCSTDIFVSSVPAPTCTINAIPNSVPYGGSSTIVWSSTGATSAYISGIGNVSTYGSRTETNIKSSRTYTMTATGPGGTSTCSTLVDVKYIPGGDLSCNIYASPNPTTTGKTTLHWYSYGNVIWTKLNGTSVPRNGSKYIVDVPSNGYRTYTLTISNGYRTQTCAVTVNGRNSTAPYCNLSASKTNINPGESTVLTWSSNNAVSAIFADNGAVSLNGSRVITPNYSKYYKLIVTSGNGVQNSCQVYINVKNPTVVNVSSVPYTGPNDVLYISLMGLVSIASFTLLYSRRKKIKNLLGM